MIENGFKTSCFKTILRLIENIFVMDDGWMDETDLGAGICAIQLLGRGCSLGIVKIQSSQQPVARLWEREDVDWDKSYWLMTTNLWQCVWWSSGFIYLFIYLGGKIPNSCWQMINAKDQADFA